MIYKKLEKKYPKVAKKYTEDKCLKCAKVPLRAVGPTGRRLKCLKLGKRRKDNRTHTELHTEKHSCSERKFERVEVEPRGRLGTDGREMVSLASYG